MATFEEQSDLIVSIITDFRDEALLLKNDTLAAIDDISTAFDGFIAALQDLDYNPSTGAITFNYSAPTIPAEASTDLITFNFSAPNVPTDVDTSSIRLDEFSAPVPAQEVDHSNAGPNPIDNITESGVAIGDAEWQRINDLAAADLALQGVGEELAAASEASWRGTAIPAIISTALLSEARQRTSDRTQAARLVSSVEQAKASREDVKDVNRLNVANYTAQWTRLQQHIGASANQLQARVSLMQAEINSEGENRTWRTEDINRLINQFQALLNRHQQEIGARAEERSWKQADVGKIVDTLRVNLERTSAQIASEAERRGYAEADVRRILEEADKTTAYAIQRAQIIGDRHLNVSKDIATLMTGLTQAFLSAVDAAMGSSVGISLSGDA